MKAGNGSECPSIRKCFYRLLRLDVERHFGGSMILRLLLILAVLALPSASWGQAPTISSLTPTSGPVGVPVTIAGSNFGSSQGSGAVALNGTSAVVTNWSDTSITVVVPVGATSGTFAVTVNSQTTYSQSFTITALPSGWSDSDVGSVGISGSASYANGTFTVKGAGAGITGTADAMHFVYQPLSGDGTIVARVVSLSPSGQAGIMIRETLNANATNAYAFYQSSYIHLYDRSSTGGSTISQASQSATLPYWVELVRSGNTFSAYTSLNGLYWTQLGTTQTITMAQSVYVSLAAQMCRGIDVRGRSENLLS